MRTGDKRVSDNDFTTALRWVPIIVFMIGFVGGFFPVWRELIVTWAESDQYSHGFLIVPISMALIWRKREFLKKINAIPDRKGLVIALIALASYMVGHFGEIKTLSSLAMWFFICGTIIYWWGLAVFRELAFPLFFLLFMIPVPSQIFASLTLPLQLFVSKISVIVAQLSGVPTFREGNVIKIPGHNLQVVEACSGLRSILSLLMLSAIWGYVQLRSNLLRWLVFLLGIPVAIFVNVVRVAVMILSFYFFNIDLTTGTIHTLFGVAIFALALILLGLITQVLTKWDYPIKKA